MLSNIYYFSGLLILLTNLSLIKQLSKILKIRDWAISYQKVTGSPPERKDFKFKEYESLKLMSSVLVINFFWIFFGLVLEDWKICFCLLLLVMFLNSLSIKFFKIKFKKASNITEYAKISIMSIAMGIIVMNHFHHRDDLWLRIIFFLQNLIYN